MWNRLDFKKIFSGRKIASYKIPIMILLTGLLLVGLSSVTAKKGSSTPTSTTSEEYSKQLEKALRSNINQLNSVEDCSVMITLSSTDENTYLENTSKSSSVRDGTEESSLSSEYLVIDSADGDTVVVASKKYPSVQGVLVVYKGENNISVKKNIIDAVSTVLGIKSNKVCVVSNQE